MMRIKALNESSSESDSDDSSDSNEVLLSREAQEQHLHFLYQEALQFLKNGSTDKAKNNLVSLLQKLKDVPDDQPFTSGDQLKFLACKNLGIIETTNIDYFLDALGIDASDICLWIKTGHRAFEVVQNYQLARNCYEAAYILSPRNWIAIDKLLDAYFVLHDLFAVVKLAVESLRIDPNYKKGLVLLYEACRLTPSWRDHVPRDLKASSLHLRKDLLDFYNKTVDCLRRLKENRKRKAEDDELARQPKRPKLDLTMEYADDIMRVIGSRIVRMYDHMQKDSVSLSIVIDVSMEEDEEDVEDSSSKTGNSQQEVMAKTEKSNESVKDVPKEISTSSDEKNSSLEKERSNEEQAEPTHQSNSQSCPTQPEQQPEPVVEEPSKCNQEVAAETSPVQTKVDQHTPDVVTEFPVERVLPESVTLASRDSNIVNLDHSYSQDNLNMSEGEENKEPEVKKDFEDDIGIQVQKLLNYLMDVIDSEQVVGSSASQNQESDLKHNNAVDKSVCREDKSSPNLNDKKASNSNQDSEENSSEEDDSDSNDDSDEESEEESDIEQVSVRDLEKQIFNDFLDEIWNIKTIRSIRILEIIHCFLVEMSKKSTGIVVPQSFTRLYDVYRQNYPIPQSFDIMIGKSVSLDDVYMTLTANELVYRPVDEYFLSSLLPQLEEILDEEKFTAYMIRLLFLRGTKGNQPECLTEVIEMLEKPKKPLRIKATNQVIISVSSVKSLILGLETCESDVNAMINNACTGPRRTRSGRLLKQPERFDTVRYVVKCPQVSRSQRKTRWIMRSSYNFMLYNCDYNGN